MSVQPEPVFLRSITPGGQQPQYVSGARATGTDTLTSKASCPGAKRIVGYQVTADADAASALVGTVTVEVSNSTELEFARGAELWTTYTKTLPVAIPAINLASGAAVTFFIELVDLGAYKVRLKFVQSSGVGYVYANAVAA